MDTSMEDILANCPNVVLCRPTPDTTQLRKSITADIDMLNAVLAKTSEKQTQIEATITLLQKVRQYQKAILNY